MQWQTWPAATASNTFIRRQRTPGRHDPGCRLDRAPALHRRRADPRAEAGAGRRLRLHGRDPADRHARGVDRNLAGNRRRRLHSCPTTGSMCFLTKRDRTPNVRAARRHQWPKSSCRTSAFLAIDQAPKEKDGQNTVVGKTVTLELKPEQAETLARARQTGTLSLALRSMPPTSTMVENNIDDSRPQAGESISVVRYGVQKLDERHRSDRKRTLVMRCRGNQLAMRTFLVRALSFSAVAALVLNPALTPVLAAETAPVTTPPATTTAAVNSAAHDRTGSQRCRSRPGIPVKDRFLALGVGKSHDRRSGRATPRTCWSPIPRSANAVIRRAARPISIGAAVGQPMSCSLTRWPADRGL